ncbi:hypothetical protein BaRGS_00023813, partial [Batillaria attramentaria]
SPANGVGNAGTKRLTWRSLVLSQQCGFLTLISVQVHTTVTRFPGAASGVFGTLRFRFSDHCLDPHNTKKSVKVYLTSGVTTDQCQD